MKSQPLEVPVVIGSLTLYSFVFCFFFFCGHILKSYDSYPFITFLMFLSKMFFISSENHYIFCLLLDILCVYIWTCTFAHVYVQTHLAIEIYSYIST